MEKKKKKAGKRRKEEHVSDIEKLKIFVKLDLQSTVGIDLFMYEYEKKYILVLDYYSYDPEVVLC